MFKGLPRWLVVKNSPAKAGNIRDGNSISRWGRSSAGGHGNPLQHPCLENPMGRGAGRLHFIALHRVRHDWSELVHMPTCSKEPSSQMIFKENFYRQNLQGVLQDMWPSTNWLVVRSQGGVPGICLLVPTSLGSPFLCLAWSFHPPPGWGLSSYRRSQWHALLCTSLVEEAGHSPITTLLFLSPCVHWPKQLLFEYALQNSGKVKEDESLLSTNRKLGTRNCICTWEGPTRSCWVSIPLFFDNPQLCGGQVLDKEGNNILDRY